MNPKKIAIALAASTALVAVPAFPAAAKQGGEGKPVKVLKGKGLAKKCLKTTAVGFVAQGAIAPSEAGSVAITVAKANKHARTWLAAGNAPTFSLTGAKLSFEGVTDGNADGTVDLADVTATDRVRVIGKLSVAKRGCTAASSLVVRKVAVSREAPETETETETETPAAPAQQ